MNNVNLHPALGSQSRLVYIHQMPFTHILFNSKRLFPGFCWSILGRPSFNKENYYIKETVQNAGFNAGAMEYNDCVIGLIGILNYDRTFKLFTINGLGR